jgi:hypothetical protein
MPFLDISSSRTIKEKKFNGNQFISPADKRKRERFSTLERGVKIDDVYVDVKIYIISAEAESRRGEKKILSGLFDAKRNFFLPSTTRLNCLRLVSTALNSSPERPADDCARPSTEPISNYTTMNR